jgi:hypothetical protein
MYEEEDGRDEHHYVLLGFMTYDEISYVLKHVDTPDNLWANREQKLASIRLFEAVLIATTGLYTSDKSVIEPVSAVWIIPTPSITRRNRSAGLESSIIAAPGHLRRSKEGGHAAGRTFGRVEGREDGVQGSLTGYLKAIGGVNVSNHNQGRVTDHAEHGARSAGQSSQEEEQAGRGFVAG